MYSEKSKIPGLIRLQQLEKEAIQKMNSSLSKQHKSYHEGRMEAFNDAQFILKFASCYTKEGFDHDLSNKLRETVYFDGNKVYSWEDETL